MPKQGVPKIRSHSKSIFQFILFSVKTSPNVFVCGLALRVRMSPSPLIHTRCTCAVINRVLQHYVAWNSSRKTLVNETCFLFPLFSPPQPPAPFPKTVPQVWFQNARAKWRRNNLRQQEQPTTSLPASSPGGTSSFSEPSPGVPLDYSNAQTTLVVTATQESLGSFQELF